MPRGGGAKAEINNLEVSFRVEQSTISNNLERDKEVVWNQSDSTISNGLKAWKFRYESPNDVVFLIPSSNGFFSALTNCKKRLIKPVTGQGFGDSHVVESSEIKLTQSSNCRHSLGRVECDIVISPDSKLKWADHHQPKVIYTAF